MSCFASRTSGILLYSYYSSFKFIHHFSFDYIWLWKFPRSSLSSMILIAWRSTGQVLYRMYFSWDLSYVFLTMIPNLWLWRGKTQRLPIIFITLYQRYVCTIKCDLAALMTLNTGLKWYLSNFFTTKGVFLLFFFFFLCSTPWKEIIMCSPHVKKRELCFASLKTEYLCKSFKIFLFVDLSFLLHLFLFKLFIYISMDLCTYLKSWVRIQCNIIDFAIQIIE